MRPSASRIIQDTTAVWCATLVLRLLAIWFILQSAIIFGVLCWIGEFIPLHEGHNAKAAGSAGVLVAYAVTVALVYLREWIGRLWRGRVKRQAARTLSLLAPNVFLA